MAASTIDTMELSYFAERSRAILRRSLVVGARGEVLVSSTSSEFPAFVATRDLASSVVALTELGSYERAKHACQFLLDVQLPSGAWESRYDADGAPANLGPAEDVTALAVWALLTYARVAGDREFADRVREPIDEAARYTLERTLNPYLYLVETSGSLHDGTIGEGYELWNNCAHAAAFALCHRMYGGERFRRLGLLIRRAIGLFMTQDGRFLRRLDHNGYPDPRPDIAIMAPYYFGLWTPNERTVMNSAELVERALWNVEIGGYAGFLPYSAAERVKLPGPWSLYSAWMAQFHFDVSNKDRAETILRWLFNMMRGGELPEWFVPAAVVRRYGREQRRALEQPLGAESGAAASERRRRLAELDHAERETQQGHSVTAGGPSLWAHLETLRALKKAGHIDHWESDSTTQSPQPDLTGS
jgi:hypothetical protein